MTLIFAVLALSGTGAVIWQRHSLSKLQENENRRFNRESATGISNAETAAIEQAVMALREQAKELPKLRNEVSRLRSARVEMERARAENARLLEAKRLGGLIPREAPPGFTSKAQLRNAGFATPEAAVETYFWAAREGNLELAMQSLSPDHGEREHFEELSPEKRQQEEDAFKTRGKSRVMAHFNDFTVAQREDLSDTAVVLHLRSSIATNTARFQLQRFGTEWKLTETFR